MTDASNTAAWPADTNSSLELALTGSAPAAMGVLPENVADWLREAQAPPRLAAHLRAVHDCAVRLTIGLLARWPRLPMAAAAITFGAATHDIGKLVYPAELSLPGRAHEAAGQDWLLARGVAPATRLAHGVELGAPAAYPTGGTMLDLTPTQVLRLRLGSLLLDRDTDATQGSGPVDPPTDVAGVVEWFGAMQAQDLNSGLWSLGCRLPGSTVAEVTAALEARAAVRTWPMRGTIHLVPSADARWMVRELGRRPLAQAAARRQVIGLAEGTADRAAEILGTALVGGRRLTRAECLQTWRAAGLNVEGQLGYHMLWYASQRGVTVIAPNVGKEQSFALLDDWVPEHRDLDREAALATIAVRYFRSHGPTTRQDLAGWLGATAAEVRSGIAGAGAALTEVRCGGVAMYAATEQLDRLESAARTGAPSAAEKVQVCGPAFASPADELLVLPGFDEYLLGFKDRSLMLAEEHKQAVIPGNNGVFQATVVRAGRVICVWKRTLTTRQVKINVRSLVGLTAAERDRVELAFAPYAAFVGLAPVFDWVTG